MVLDDPRARVNPNLRRFVFPEAPVATIGRHAMAILGAIAVQREATLALERAGDQRSIGIRGTEYILEPLHCQTVLSKIAFAQSERSKRRPA